MIVDPDIFINGIKHVSGNSIYTYSTFYIKLVALIEMDIVYVIKQNISKRTMNER